MERSKARKVATKKKEETKAVVTRPQSQCPIKSDATLRDETVYLKRALGLNTDFRVGVIRVVDVLKALDVTLRSHRRPWESTVVLGLRAETPLLRTHAQISSMRKKRNNENELRRLAVKPSFFFPFFRFIHFFFRFRLSSVSFYVTVALIVLEGRGQQHEGEEQQRHFVPTSTCALQLPPTPGNMQICPPTRSVNGYKAACGSPRGIAYLPLYLGIGRVHNTKSNCWYGSGNLQLSVQHDGVTLN